MFRSLAAAFVALVASCASPATAAPPPPGALFDLSKWVLQLPVSDGKGGVVQVKQPALATYSSAYFFTDAATNAMTFWCPEDGAHTSGSSFPRSELRQVPDFTLGHAAQLNVTMSVSKLPTGGSITVGQIHFDGISGHCSICIELEYTDGDLLAHLRDKSCKSVTKTVGKGYTLGQHFSYSLTVDNALSVRASSDTGTMAPYAYDWAIGGCGMPVGKCPLYFKMGDYVQTASSSSSNGGIVAIHAYSMSGV